MKRCIACGAPLWETPLLTLDNMPASAQHMPDADHVGADKGLTLDHASAAAVVWYSLTASLWIITGM
ncbi:MAG: hypothetical protein ACLT0W_11510 [Clostridium sp.]